MKARVELIDNSEQIVLAMSRSELLLLAGSVGEAIEAVGDWEFSSRLGAEKAAARQLRRDLGVIISELPPVE
jgi:hypothetical protein